MSHTDLTPAAAGTGSPDDPAHFYKFGSIVAGRELIATPTGYAYGLERKARLLEREGHKGL